MACYYPSRAFLNQFSSFINTSSARFTDSLLFHSSLLLTPSNALFMSLSQQYGAFTTSVRVRGPLHP